MFFEYVNVPRLSNVRSATPVHGEQQQGVPKKDAEDTKMGYNMCECGFEGINLKVGFMCRRSTAACF